MLWEKSRITKKNTIEINLLSNLKYITFKNLKTPVAKGYVFSFVMRFFGSRDGNRTRD